MKKIDILVGFQNIFTKIGVHFGLGLYHRMAKVKLFLFGLCVNQLVNFFAKKLKKWIFG